MNSTAFDKFRDYTVISTEEAAALSKAEGSQPVTRSSNF